MREGLRALGVEIRVEGETWHVQGAGGRLQAPRNDAPLDVGASGTTARFLTAAACLADGPVRVDGTPRMRERPIRDLVDGLAGLGAKVEILGADGCPPLRVAGGGIPGGESEIDASRSSQYVSGILLAAPCAGRDVTLRFRGGRLVSRPFVDLTLQVMRAFGARAAWLPDAVGLRVDAGAPYQGRRYVVEPDAQSAVYAFCAAAVSGGRVEVQGIPADSLQADLRVLDALEEMGCRVQRDADRVRISGAAAGLRGIRLDGNPMPDAVLALAVVALFADGPTEIFDVGNLRIKESDRLAALECELQRLGARVETGPDWLRIEPGPLHGASLDTYDDHRIAMALALAGLRVPGVSIRDPGCVSKTWPEFFQALDRW
jgi:3-phosphoshikimate 1-carboxyvinyltransferase